jgi:alkanesulfonate monooxygenase SsuD/methylene tetrahydromethanopterin reductase-like flavin-dependent oxidoreductase (luciferase family)
MLWSFRNPEFARGAWDDVYRSHLELAVESEALGFDYAWLTEHHFVDDGYSSSPFVTAAAIAARTERIRLGTFVVVLPMHNAVEVAENVATLDQISGGRFELGVGLGSRSAEFDDQGLPRNDRGVRLEESLTVIRRLLSGETVTFDGKYTTLREVRIVPPALQMHPQIWAAGMVPKAIDRLARLGCHFLGSGAADLCNAYDEALRTHGREPEDHNIAGQQLMYVAPTREEAWETAAPLLRYYTEETLRWILERGDHPEYQSLMDSLPSVEEIVRTQQFDFFGEQPMVGTPNEVIGMIEEYTARSRVTHLVCNIALPGLTTEQIRAAMQRFAAEVMPHFRQAVPEPVAGP